MGRLIALFLWMIATGLSEPDTAVAGERLDALGRGRLVCGVSDDTFGFSRADFHGKWRGLSGDMCRAVAAALLGDAKKAAFVPVAPPQEYADLRSGAIDMLASSLPSSMEGQSGRDVSLAAVYYYDRVGFLVPRGRGWKDASDLNGATACMTANAAVERAVSDYFAASGMTYSSRIFRTRVDERRAFFSGQCDVLVSTFSILKGTRTGYAANPADYALLPQTIAMVQLGLIVRRGDRRLAEVARMVVDLLVQAEELGVTSRNIDALANARDPAVDRLLTFESAVSRSFSLEPGWARRTIKQVGSYAEIYDRNVGAASELNVPRELNNTASNGGLLYAPTLR